MAPSGRPFFAMLIRKLLTVCQGTLGARRSETSHSAFQEQQLVHRGQCEPHDVINHIPWMDFYTEIESYALIGSFL